MKILSISDVHGEYNENFINYLKNNKDIDLILINGDITNFGPLEFVGDFIDSIVDLDFDVIAIQGNCDPKEVPDVIKDTNGTCLHKNVKTYGNVIIFGFGGSNPTPFNTPGEFEDEYLYENIKELLLDYEKNMDDEDLKVKILLTHAPPLDSEADKIPDGVHVGSKAIRDIIEEFNIDINLCGHIHEAKSIDNIANTIVVNPGMLKDNHGCLVTIDDDTLDFNVEIVPFKE